MFNLENSVGEIQTDDLLKKISKRTKTLKIKLINDGWLAQVRVYINGERSEVSEIASNPKEALKLLDKRMEREGIYER